MGSKSSSAKKTVKKASSTVKKPLAVVKKKVSSRSAAVIIAEQNRRRKFVAAAVIVSAALLAILIGLMGYERGVKSTIPEVSSGQGIVYVKASSDLTRTANSTFSVELYENSGTESINALQSSINYPAEMLEVVGIRSSATFPQEAATDTKTAGLIRIARAVTDQSQSVKGAHSVATIQFRLKQDAKSPVRISIDNASSLLVRSTDNKNILNSNGTYEYSL